MVTRLLPSDAAQQAIGIVKLLLGGSGDAGQDALSQFLSRTLVQGGLNSTVHAFDGLFNKSSPQVTIVIGQVEQSLLLAPSPKTFQILKELMLPAA
ncbi:hypothetical protein FSST1_007683 [Fusarium sambucinum]